MLDLVSKIIDTRSSTYREDRTMTATSPEAGFDSRVQLALRVADLEGSVAFYSTLFGVEPAKRRPGYANFAIASPPLKLVLIEGQAGEGTRLDHLGVEVGTTEQVATATGRLAAAGRTTLEENDTTCCYALQDKVWVSGPGPGGEPWEVYTVKADAETLTRAADSACCTPGDTAGSDSTRQGAVPAGAGCCG
jgi:catechol 2,3-dioxygenase-like lactoylglutathione lyase family enzyme